MVAYLIANTVIEPYVTAGTFIIVAVIGATATLGAAWLTSVGKKLDKTVKQTEHTGNGFAGDVRQFMDDTREFMRHSAHHGEFQDELLIAIDNRVTKLEETE